MYCKNCGKLITSIATECPYCHAKVVEDTQISSNSLLYNNANSYTYNNSRYNKQNNSPIVNFIASICIIIGIIILIKNCFDFAEWTDNYYGANSNKRYGTNTSTTLKTKNSLELVGNVSVTSSGGYGYYTHYFEGILKNVSGRKLDYAQVSFVIYDTAGNNIGSAFDNVNFIDVNGTWKFKAMYFGEEQRIKYNLEPEISSW